MEVLELLTEVHFTYLTDEIIEGVIIGQRFTIVKQIGLIVKTLTYDISYNVAVKNKEGKIVDWRWLPSEVVRAQRKQINGYR